MSTHVLLSRLSRAGIQIEVHNDRIRYSPISAMTAELADEIRTHKAALIASLTGSCSPHNNPLNYIDVSTGDGRLMTTCRECDRFIGYRPEVLR